jgi:hypothetical protein
MIEKIKKLFENICNTVDGINEFGFGIVANEKNIKASQKYPSLWVNEEVRITYKVANKAVLPTYDLNIFMFNRWGENQDAIASKYQQLSQLERIFQDVVAITANPITPFVSIEWGDAITFVDSFNDRTVGLSCGVKITMFSGNVCYLTPNEINSIYQINC